MMEKGWMVRVVKEASVMRMLIVLSLRRWCLVRKYKDESLLIPSLIFLPGVE